MLLCVAGMLPLLFWNTGNTETDTRSGECLKENMKCMTMALGPDVGNHKTTHFWRLSCPIPPLNVGWEGGADDVEIITRFLTSTLRS